MSATNAPASNNKPVDQMNVHELRTHISDLVRTDFSDRLAELERLMKEAVWFLEQKETKPKNCIIAGNIVHLVIVFHCEVVSQKQLVGAMSQWLTA